MISSIVSRLVILVFGTLYPAYASYKAVRTKDVKEYVKWMMYWIVFALFTCAETFTDVFIGFWFPFYYEIKIILVIWLLSPATKGSSILYRKFVHPTLKKREQEIDEAIMQAKQQGYHTILSLGTKGVNYATSVIMQTAIKGGGGLVNQLRKSYSLTDLSVQRADSSRAMALDSLKEENDTVDRPDGDPWNMLHSKMLMARRSASGSTPLEMYFSELDVDLRQRGKGNFCIPPSYIRSTEDISSGYSSADPLFTSQSAASTPTGECSIDEMMRISSLASVHRPLRPRKAPRAGSTSSVPTKRGSEGNAPLADLDEFDLLLDKQSLPSPLLSKIILAQFSQKLPLLNDSVLASLLEISNSKENEPALSFSHTDEKCDVKCQSDCDTVFTHNEEETESKMYEDKKINIKGDDDEFEEAKQFEEGEKSVRRSSTPAQFEDAVDDSSLANDKDEFRKEARSGRYKKLRAPSPPSKLSLETEALSDSESGDRIFDSSPSKKNNKEKNKPIS